MKLQKLTIHNIASIEDAIIDFDSEPLSSSEVFLISGNTGSGKSTILDAICLALYANTPRMENTNMQGETPDGDKSVKIYDPRQLMRRNTGEAYCSLTFIGSNGIHYEAIWSVARARNKPGGNIQGKKWSLTNMETNHTLTKDEEIRAGIKAAIELDFNQFCRTTMLAQGEFTRFLNSKDEEKAAILEKITGVDIYSRIGRKAYEVCTSKEAEWKEAQKKIEDINVLSEEEIARKRAEIDAIGTEYERIRELRASDEQKRLWLSRETELTGKVTKASEAYRAASEVISGEEFRRKAEFVSLWNSTIDARQWLRNAKSAGAEKQKLESALSKLSEEFSWLMSGRLWHAAEIGRIEAKLAETSQYIESEKEKEGIYAIAQTICGHLDTILGSRKKITEENTRISAEEKLIYGELQQRQNTAENSMKAARTAFETQKSIFEKKEQELAEAGLPTLRTQKDSRTAVISAINIAKGRIETLENERERARKAHESLSLMSRKIEGLTEEACGFESALHDAKIRMDERRKSRDEQRISVDEWAKGIRSRLGTGDICPVCGQRIACELPHEDDLDILFATAEKAFRESEEEYLKAVGQYNRIQADIKALQSSYADTKKALDEDRSLQNAESNAAIACSRCGIEDIDSGTMERLDAGLEREIAAKNGIEQLISAAESIEKEAKESQRQMEMLRKAWDEAKERATAIDRQISESQNRIASSRGIINSTLAEISASESFISENLGCSIWQNDWKTETESFRQEVAYCAGKFSQQTTARQLMQSEYNEKQIIMENIDSQISAITGLMPGWSKIRTDSPARIDRLQERLSTLRTEVKSAVDSIARVEMLEMEAKCRLREYMASGSTMTEERLEHIDRYSTEDIADLSDSIKESHNAAIVNETALMEATKMLEEHSAARPAIDEHESIEFLSRSICGKEEAMNALQEKKGAVNQELKADADNKARLQMFISDAETKKAEYRKWSRLNQLIGDATGNRFRKIAQSYVLSSLIHSANAYMKTLTDRYTLTVNPGTFVISIEDAYQGFARRAASTISGGESFLVSLSLALALSDIGQHLSVDTLFIDEGFGTLSGEALQNAVNTLRSLHTKAGRHVGIISHVEELRERIPVQIKVEQEGHNSSSKVYVTTL